MVRAAVLLCLLCGCDNLFGLSRIEADAPAADDAHALDATPSGSLVYSGTVSSATDLDVSFATAPVAGSMIVVFVSTFKNVLDTVSDDAGNTYSLTPVHPATSEGGSQLWLLYAAGAMTVPEFRIHIASHAAENSLPDESETSAVVLAYPGSSLAFDLVSYNAGVGSGTAIVQDCGAVTTLPGAIVVAGVSHDFQGTTTAGAGYNLRAIASESYLTNATLAVEDAMVGDDGDPATPLFSTTYTTGAPAWVCATATFHAP